MVADFKSRRKPTMVATLVPFDESLSGWERALYAKRLVNAGGCPAARRWVKDKPETKMSLPADSATSPTPSNKGSSLSGGVGVRQP
jgi:hypothetical protein